MTPGFIADGFRLQANALTVARFRQSVSHLPADEKRAAEGPIAGGAIKFRAVDRVDVRSFDCVSTMTEPTSHLRKIGVLQLLTKLSNHLRSPIPLHLRFCRQLVPVEITKVWPMRDPVANLNQTIFVLGYQFSPLSK